jgi:hypothetical protein
VAESIEQPALSQLWKQLPEGEKLRAAEAFWREPEGIEQQVEAMALLAQRLKARPRYIQGLPVEKRARHLAHFPGMPDVLVARLLVSYHLAHQRPMMAAFLDAIGLAHDNGLITEDPAGPISAEQIAAGEKALASAYPAEAVKLYFSTLLAQDPDTWKGLAAHIEQS